MFWNVTFIYNAFIRTTDQCRVQTAFVSLFYIFINMKPWNASNSSVVVGGLLLIMQISKLFHWKTTPTRAFNEFLYEFLRFFFNFAKFVKIRNFFCWGNEFSIYAAHWETIKHIGYNFVWQKQNDMQLQPPDTFSGQWRDQGA